jgi:UDP-N-acetylglucosamine 4-epimerase
MIEGDITDPASCCQASRGVDYVLHQAALGSVPRSIEEPLRTNASNVDGFVNMLIAAREAQVQRFVYASSSAVYGDDEALPKTEDQVGAPLSPYALSKLINEQYAAVFARCYGMRSVGLRYFNVFGQRQDPQGDYAAVIPRWIATMLAGEPVTINGDGETSRDFCYIANVVQANILAALADDAATDAAVYNVALGARTSLNKLYASLKHAITNRVAGLEIAAPIYGDFRAGDVRHSVADIGKAARLLQYQPTHDFDQGIGEAIAWYIMNPGGPSSSAPSR